MSSLDRLQAGSGLEKKLPVSEGKREPMRVRELGCWKTAPSSLRSRCQVCKVGPGPGPRWEILQVSTSARSTGTQSSNFSHSTDPSNQSRDFSLCKQITDLPKRRATGPYCGVCQFLSRTGPSFTNQMVGSSGTQQRAAVKVQASEPRSDFSASARF